MDDSSDNNCKELIRKAKRAVEETQQFISALRKSTLEVEQLLKQQREELAILERKLKEMKIAKLSDE